MRSPSLALLCLVAAVGCGSAETETETEASEGELVGGTRDQRWAGSGYLVRGPSMDRLELSRPACGATLIAKNVVVTAAHCVTDADATFAFGVGDVGKGEIVRVIERHAHPEFHPTPEGMFDLTHTLRNYDVAYLVLERDIDSAIPAELPNEAPPIGCNAQAIGYRAETSVGGAIRKSTPACVLLRLTLGRDPILEVRPQGGTALCLADGDEGSPIVSRDPDRHVLIGIFVGSITSALTDCRRGTQFLNGYESAYGYREFLREGIARSRR